MNTASSTWPTIQQRLGDHGVYDSRTWARSACPDYEDAEDFRWAPRLARKRLTALALHLAIDEGLSIAAALNLLLTRDPKRNAQVASSYPFPVMSWVATCDELERTLIHAVTISCAVNAFRLLPPLPRPVAADVKQKRKIGRAPATGYVATQWDLVAGPRSERTVVRIASGPLGSPVDLLVDAVAYGAAAEETVGTVVEIAPDSGELRELTLDDASREAGIEALIDRAVGIAGRERGRVSGDWCSRCWLADTCADALGIGREMRDADSIKSPTSEVKAGFVVDE